MLGPILSSRASNQVEDLVDLLHLAFARQQGGIQDEFPHDAAHAPHVDGSRVLLHTCTDRQLSTLSQLHRQTAETATSGRTDIELRLPLYVCL